MSDKGMLLLVEGKTDKYVISSLCEKLNIDMPNNIKIEVSGNIQKLKKLFKTSLKSSNNYSKVWAIIDADSSFAPAWDSMKSIIRDSKRYNNAIKNLGDFPKDGLVLYPDDPTEIIIGLWIMPNNSDRGMLEDFLINLIEEKDSLYKKAETIVDELNSERDKYSSLFKEVHTSKAKVHTWLAWQDEPRMSIGSAINERLLNTNKELCNNFEAWIKQLIED